MNRLAGTVRAATPADLPAITAVEQECLPLDPWSPNLLREAVGGTVPTVRMLVAEVAGAVVGHAITSVVQDVAELQRIAVLPSHRRTGLASLLLAEVAADARAEGAERVLLEVRVTNAPAVAFYAARGFTEIARRPRYYRDGETAVVMERPLTVEM